MSGVKHTPGPWEANFSFPGRDGIGDVWQIDADGHAVCTTQFCYAPNTEANALLIAAAPDLLEALEAVLNTSGARPSGYHAIEYSKAVAQAENAIIKARATSDRPDKGGQQ